MHLITTVLPFFLPRARFEHGLRVLSNVIQTQQQELNFHIRHIIKVEKERETVKEKRELT